MHSQEILQKYQLTNTPNPVNQKKIELQRTQYNHVNASDNFANQAGIIFSSIIFVSGLLAFLNSKYIKGESDNWFTSENYKYKLPCKTCRYYSKNNYLPCAVNPSIAMTESARHCADYSIHDKRFSLKNKFRFWK